MAVPKIVGVETELGIMVHGTQEWNPVSASSALIDAYTRSLSDTLGEPGRLVAWDYMGESPTSDARADPYSDDQYRPIGEPHLVNTVLTNGARYYVDHAHPEISTPECTSALSLVAYDRAGELIAQESMRAVGSILPAGQEVVLYKDNSDRKGNSYGCHENYLISRQIPFGAIAEVATTHFVTRQIFTGSGKLGSELPGSDPNSVDFQITQRADHFEEEIGLETTLKRPIVNTRDEPHCDPAKYRRLHVIAGDANLSQVATLLKVGTSAIVFAMLEDGFLKDLPTIVNPVSSMHKVSRDLSLNEPLILGNGQRATPVEVQRMLYARALEWSATAGLDSVGGEESGLLVLSEWDHVLTGLESDPMGLADRLDWVAKHRLLTSFMDRHDCGWTEPRLKLLDLRYHDLRPDHSLAAKLGLRTLVSDEEAARAVTEPPSDTRAYFRGASLKKFAESIVSANWDSIVFDVGEEGLKRVPMMEPTRGTRKHVANLIDTSSTAAELVARLGA